MHVNKTESERNSSLEYYHVTFIGKTKHTSYRRILLFAHNLILRNKIQCLCAMDAAFYK